MSQQIPAVFFDAIERAHVSWHACLIAGLQTMQQADPDYLDWLAQDDFLPNDGRLFAAFSIPLDSVRHVLVGEGPYPRAASASGYCFMDAAVQELWSEKGLSKPVNRATSLRNFMKMLLVVDGNLSVDKTSGDAVRPIAEQALGGESAFILSREALQENLLGQGFLLLNATLAYRAHVSPTKEARAWQPFLRTVLAALQDQAGRSGATLPTLVLWGKVAERLAQLPETAFFPQAVSEHPYNLSFIANKTMQDFFRPMGLLKK